VGERLIAFGARKLSFKKGGQDFGFQVLAG
jgi:hypothetical protein